ncbi:hypothetical protein niasHT_028212 [Heterodera trifolii]|uniref:MULE transposase domain-containing protein n=1 Tax=Heterodera trifolii TaxID=157864 RepID=A0ABD2K992_9BILA
MDQQQQIKTKRNKITLEHDGALYVFDQFSADGLKKFWRCEFHGPADKCKGRLHTDSNNVVQKKVGVHSCDMNAARVECQRLVTGLKRRAAETCEAPGTIRAQVLQNTCTPVLAAFPSKYATKKVIKRLRRDENAPRAEPLNLEQLEIPNAYRVYNRIETEEEQFLLADTGVFQIQGQNGPQRILIFGRASTAVWTHEMKNIYADGTFALTPPLFSQIYVLLAKRDGWVFPICYCLLTSKCTAIYTRMLQLLLERWPNFAPQTISLDFELAMVGAVRTVLPACSVRYCFFHLVRNMKKKITALGLTRVYNTDPIFAEKSKMITSLAFLPVHHLQAGLNAIQAQLPAQLHGIFNWFLDNYTGKPWFNGAMTVPKFDPNECSVHQRTLDGGDRTNNFAEAFHRKLQRQFNCTHPTMWRFIDTIGFVNRHSRENVPHAKTATRKRASRENGHAKTATRKRPRENVLAPFYMVFAGPGRFRVAVFAWPFSRGRFRVGYVFAYFVFFWAAAVPITQRALHTSDRVNEAPDCWMSAIKLPLKFAMECFGEVVGPVTTIQGSLMNTTFVWVELRHRHCTIEPRKLCLNCIQARLKVVNSLCVVTFLLAAGGSILWFFFDHVKKRLLSPKKEIFICGDCWLKVFHFLAPSQLGLGIALVNRRFDFIVDEHFKTRKWKLEKQFIIQWDIEENGTKKMQIVKSDGNPMPIPQNPLPNKVIGFRRIQIIYIDQNVIAFFRRFRRIFAICAIDLIIVTENVPILDYFLLNIWPILHDFIIRVIGFNAITFRRLRQLAPSLLTDCSSIRFVSFIDAILPAFPPDESANASDGQALTKWLFMPCPDGLPKWFRCSVNSPDQWFSMIEQLKTAFSNASSPITFRIFMRFSAILIDSVVPFDLINDLTGEQLTLQQYDTDEFCLTRSPIGWDERKWENVQDELLNDDPMNHIRFLIRDGGFDEGLLDAASPGPSDH